MRVKGPMQVEGCTKPGMWQTVRTEPCASPLVTVFAETVDPAREKEMRSYEKAAHETRFIWQ